METIKTAQQTRTKDTERRVRQEAPKNNQNRKLQSFLEFSAKRRRLRLENGHKPISSKAKKLHEVLGDFDPNVCTSIFAVIPMDASDRAQSLTIVTNQLRAMSDNKMNIAITCVGFGDDQIVD